MSRFSDEGALEQLVAVDLVYLGAIALLNFAFPYILLPVAINPTQLLAPPAPGQSRRMVPPSYSLIDTTSARSKAVPLLRSVDRFSLGNQ